MAKVDVTSLIKDTFAEWSEDKASRLGAAVAYYTIFSMAPLLVVVIAIAGLVFGDQAVRGQISGQIQGLVGQEGAAMIQTMIVNANKPATSIIATILGIVTLLLGATGLFGELQDALNTIWEVTPKPRGVWTMIRVRFVSFGMVLGIAFLLLVSLVISAGLAALGHFLNGLMPVPEFVLQAIDFVVSFGVITLLFAMMYKVLPDAETAWKDVVIGAAVTSLLFTVGKLLIGLYLGHSGTASTYGAAGSLVVLLLWVYYSAQIFFFGAEFTQLYANRYGSKIKPAADATALADQMRQKDYRPDTEHDSSPDPSKGKVGVDAKKTDERKPAPARSPAGSQFGPVAARPEVGANGRPSGLAFAVAVVFGVAISVARAMRSRANRGGGVGAGA